MLYEIFCGNYVQVFVKSLKASSEKKGKVNNVILVGYLLDEDKEYIFLGQTPDDVFAAVKKDEIAAINLTDEGELILEEINIPEDQEMQ